MGTTRRGGGGPFEYANGEVDQPARCGWTVSSGTVSQAWGCSGVQANIRRISVVCRISLLEDSVTLDWASKVDSRLAKPQMG